LWKENSLCSYLGANRCLNICVEDKCSCETYSLALQCRKTGAATFASTSKTHLCSEWREMFFLMSFRELIMKQRSEVAVRARKTHLPLQLRWTEREAALSHSALVNRRRDRTTCLHRCHPHPSTWSLTKY